MNRSLPALALLSIVSLPVACPALPVRLAPGRLRLARPASTHVSLAAGRSLFDGTRASAGGPVGSLPPGAEDERVKELKDVLGSLGVADAEVRVYADTPSRWASGSNIASIAIPDSGSAYQELGRISKGLGKTSLSWQPGAWELAVKGKWTFRSAIPFPGKPVEAERTAGILARLPDGIATYQPPFAGEPFEGALLIDHASRTQARYAFGLGGWTLYERQASQGEPQLPDYYLQRR